MALTSTIDLPMRPIALFRILLAATGISISIANTQAQLVLPGARPAEPLGASSTPANAARPKSRPIAMQKLKPPSLDGVVDHALMLNATTGEMMLRSNGEGVDVVKLILQGAQISHPDSPCKLSVVSGQPLSTTNAGLATGVAHFAVNFPACPFEFDVLEGALLVSPRTSSCKVAAADCKINPSGLWGPPATTQGVAQAKLNERARAAAEGQMRALFRMLIKKTRGKPNIEAVANEQAGFSSRRSTLCRDYANDGIQDFCALRLTQARNFALNSAILLTPDPAPRRKKAARHR